MVDGPSSLTLVLTFAEPAIVFILLEFRELEEFGVLKVPDGLSELSWGGRGKRLRSHACLNAAFGVILVAGSHSRHLRMKSRKSGSSQPFSAVWSSLEPGGPLGFPLLDLPPLSTVVPSGSVVAVQYRGYPLEDMKFFARFDWSRSFCGGIPKSSIIHDN